MIYLFYTGLSLLLGIVCMGLGLWVLCCYHHRPTSRHLGWPILTGGLVSCAYIGSMISPNLLYLQLAFMFSNLFMPFVLLGIILYRGNPKEEQIPLGIIVGIGFLFGLLGWMRPAWFFEGFYTLKKSDIYLNMLPPNLGMLFHESFSLGLLVLVGAFTMRFTELENKLKVWQLLGLGLGTAFLHGLSTPLDSQVNSYPIPHLAPLIYPFNSLILFYVFVVLKPEIKLAYAIELNPNAWHDLRNLVHALHDHASESHSLQVAVRTLQSYLDEISHPKAIHGSYLQKEDVLINALLQQTGEFWRVSAQKKNIAYQLIVPDDEMIMTLDPIGFRRVLDNLLQNAIKFTPTNGSIRLAAFFTETHYHISIQDSGIGIPPEEQKMIFQQAWRGHSAQGIPGQGLGLASVALFAKQHQGQLEVQSEEGEGTRITLILPID